MQCREQNRTLKVFQNKSNLENQNVSLVNCFRLGNMSEDMAVKMRRALKIEFTNYKINKRRIQTKMKIVKIYFLQYLTHSHFISSPTYYFLYLVDLSLSHEYSVPYDNSSFYDFHFSHHTFLVNFFPFFLPLLFRSIPKKSYWQQGLKIGLRAAGGKMIIIFFCSKIAAARKERCQSNALNVTQFLDSQLTSSHFVSAFSFHFCFMYVTAIR